MDFVAHLIVWKPKSLMLGWSTRFSSTVSLAANRISM